MKLPLDLIFIVSVSLNFCSYVLVAQLKEELSSAILYTYCIYTRAVNINTLIYAINVAEINAIKYFNVVYSRLTLETNPTLEDLQRTTTVFLKYSG